MLLGKLYDLNTPKGIHEYFMSRSSMLQLNTGKSQPSPAQILQETHNKMIYDYLEKQEANEQEKIRSQELEEAQENYTLSFEFNVKGMKL